MYGRGSGTVDLPGAMPSFSLSCVPRDAPGPSIDAVHDVIKTSERERPATWRVVESIALPEGVKPVSYTHLDVYKRQVSPRVAP